MTVLSMQSIRSYCWRKQLYDFEIHRPQHILLDSVRTILKAQPEKKKRNFSGKPPFCLVALVSFCSFCEHRMLSSQIDGSNLFLCFHMCREQSVSVFLGQENDNLFDKSMLKETHDQLVLGRARKITKVDCAFCNPLARNLDICPSSKDCFMSQFCDSIFWKARLFSALWLIFKSSIMLPSRCSVLKVIWKMIQICMSTNSKGTRIQFLQSLCEVFKFLSLW